jgi:hypothetical protein
MGRHYAGGAASGAVTPHYQATQRVDLSRVDLSQQNFTDHMIAL